MPTITEMILHLHYQFNINGNLLQHANQNDELTGAIDSLS